MDSPSIAQRGPCRHLLREPLFGITMGLKIREKPLLQGMWLVVELGVGGAVFL